MLRSSQSGPGGSLMETHLLQDYTRNATRCWGSNLVENENSIYRANSRW